MVIDLGTREKLYHAPPPTVKFPSLSPALHGSPGDPPSRAIVSKDLHLHRVFDPSYVRDRDLAADCWHDSSIGEYKTKTTMLEPNVWDAQQPIMRM